MAAVVFLSQKFTSKEVFILAKVGALFGARDGGLSVMAWSTPTMIHKCDKLSLLKRLCPCPAAQPFPPDAQDSCIELPNCPVVRRASVVLVMAAELDVQGFLLLAHRIVNHGHQKMQ